MLGEPDVPTDGACSGERRPARGPDFVDGRDVLPSRCPLRRTTCKGWNEGFSVKCIPGFMDFVIPPRLVNQALTHRALGARGRVFEVVFELFLRAVCDTSQPAGLVSAPQRGASSLYHVSKCKLSIVLSNMHNSHPTTPSIIFFILPTCKLPNSPARACSARGASMSCFSWPPLLAPRITLLADRDHDEPCSPGFPCRLKLAELCSALSFAANSQYTGNIHVGRAAFITRRKLQRDPLAETVNFPGDLRMI